MMPELPEVENIVRQLKPALTHRVLDSLTVHWARTVTLSESDRLTLHGRTIEEVDRRGKWILIHLNGGLRLTIHLRMTGRLTLIPLPDRTRHLRAIFNFEDGDKLYFYDVRKFGRISLIQPGQTSLDGLGVEPLTPGGLETVFSGIRSHRTVKAILLDQTLIAGIGNIYADEALFSARIHPATPVDTLSSDQKAALIRSLRFILQTAIDSGGSTISDYRSLSGEAGRHQLVHQVYRRTAQACFICQSPIEYCRLAGRGTHFCPHCQALTSLAPRV